VSYDRLIASKRARDDDRGRQAEHDRAFRDAVRTAHASGMSLGQIARVVGLSTQRIHQMVKEEQ
jgi:transposase-like protein